MCVCPLAHTHTHTIRHWDIPCPDTLIQVPSSYLKAKKKNNDNRIFLYIMYSAIVQIHYTRYIKLNKCLIRIVSTTRIPSFFSCCVRLRILTERRTRTLKKYINGTKTNTYYMHKIVNNRDLSGNVVLVYIFGLHLTLPCVLCLAHK